MLRYDWRYGLKLIGPTFYVTASVALGIYKTSYPNRALDIKIPRLTKKNELSTLQPSYIRLISILNLVEYEGCSSIAASHAIIN